MMKKKRSIVNKKVKCIDGRKCKHLTTGKIYETCGLDIYIYHTIINDKGIKGNYLKTRFVDATEDDLKPQKPVKQPKYLYFECKNENKVPKEFKKALENGTKTWCPSPIGLIDVTDHIVYYRNGVEYIILVEDSYELEAKKKELEL